MTDKLTKQDVIQVAKLARLKCSDEEIDMFTVQLGAILQYVDQLSEVNTDGIEPLAHCLAVSNVLRDDVVTESLPNDKALQNAPHRDGEYFGVPKVLGESS
ncbi:MAG: Asp-tRNA(Asn)/Glu-tRNA(Gln) amidotransferase subunit GatC [Phycisphaerae bacterium]|nr:Asp-tRNA(Asn)/Glu-tRNA(Gln) amidotransferase subunit GatC [Phycisphaerae bacterium]